MVSEKSDTKTEAGIIDIIQKMVAEGESDEKIVRTLKDLGVDEDKARRLLILGQADTFALLRNEISKIVAADVEKERMKMIELVRKESEAAAEKAKLNVEKKIIEDLKKYEKDITGQSLTFQEQISDTVKKFAELNERVKEKLNELGQQVHTLQLDMDELKLKGVGSRNRFVSLTLIILGIIFCCAALYLFYTKFGAAVSIDSIIVTVVMALVGITMLFVATLM